MTASTVPTSPTATPCPVGATVASISTVGIVGVGAMGRGIAQIFAQAGLCVKLFDTKRGAAIEARDAVCAHFSRLQEKGKLSPQDAAAAGACLHVLTEIEDLAGCDVVVEAIIEQLDAKITLFANLEAIVRPDCILATNTSSLSVTAIAAGLKRPERVAGLHFFNPVPLMKVVEVISGVLTAPDLDGRLRQLVQRSGHLPVSAKDTPGFIVNHAGRGYVTEALRIVQENVAGFADIDAVLREAAGFRLGPFQLMDLTGLDVSHPVMEAIYTQYYQEPRYRPSLVTGQRLAARLLGKKTGRGFYRYDGVVADTAQPEAPCTAPWSGPVWIGEAGLPSDSQQSGNVQSTDRAVSDRQSSDRPSSDRPSSDRPSSDRQSSDRQSSDRASSDRPSSDRPFSDRQSADRPFSDRQSSDRASADSPSDHQSLAALLARCGVAVETGASPSPGALCLVAPLGEDVTACVLRLGLDARRTLGVDPLQGFSGRLTLMVNPATEPGLARQAKALLEAGGQPATLIEDSAGFITQRVLAMVVNIACDMAQQGICNPHDLDRAVELGLAYPRGPLAWGDHLGPRRVLAILRNLLAASGDPRYRPSPWLVRRAGLGLSLRHCTQSA